MFKDLLPIGSIVKIKNAEREFMICGRVVAKSGSKEVYDYLGCMYPEGIIDPSELYFFNQIGIEECVYRGFEDDQELNFRKNVLETLNDVQVVDGKIVPKPNTPQ